MTRIWEFGSIIKDRGITICLEQTEPPNLDQLCYIYGNVGERILAISHLLYDGQSIKMLVPAMFGQPTPKNSHFLLAYDKLISSYNAAAADGKGLVVETFVLRPQMLVPCKNDSCVHKVLILPLSVSRCAKLLAKSIGVQNGEAWYALVLLAWAVACDKESGQVLLTDA